jgi:DNA-binding transcriptional MocR family regulator
VTRPQGGYFVWVELPPAIDARVLLRQALEAGISLMPGQLFSADRRFGHCVRLNYGASDAPTLEAATRRLGQLAQALLA